MERKVRWLKTKQKTSFAKVQVRGSGSVDWVLVEMGKPEQMEGNQE